MLVRGFVFSLIFSCVVELEDSFVLESVFLVEIVCVSASRVCRGFVVVERPVSTMFPVVSVGFIGCSVIGVE